MKNKVLDQSKLKNNVYVAFVCFLKSARQENRRKERLMIRVFLFFFRGSFSPFFSFREEGGI